VPIYEFICEACGARFERLLDAGAEGPACPECGADRTRRVFSAQAPTPHLVKTPAENRKQERRNARLMKDAKASYKAKRARVQAARAGKKGS
jgi:putative FmdB family regulatory protein